MRVFKALAHGIGLFVVLVVVGNIAYRVLADLLPSARMDRSEAAAQGAGTALALVAWIGIAIVRARRRTPRA